MTDFEKAKDEELTKRRSLGEAVRFATSDISEFQKVSDREAEAILNNANTTILLKVNDQE